MSINQDITKYGGTVPDKDTQTPSEFNNAADSFVDWMEGIPSEINTWANEANSTADTVNTYKNDAESARDTALNYRDTAQTYKDEAFDWATGSEDTEYTDSDGNTGYSAYHWAQKSAKGERLTATSSSSVDIGTGSKTFTLAESYRAFTVGSQVRVVDGANPVNNYMEGTVTSYDDGTDELTVDVANTTGSGTISDWYIGLDHGGDASTLNGQTGFPSLSTLSATDVTGSGATLRCSVDAFGMIDKDALEIAFDYKEDGATSWTRTATQAVSTLTTVTQAISGLSITTTYVFRPVALDVLNPSVEIIGDEASFTTPDVYIEAPTITNPSDGATDIGETPTLSADTFNCVNGSDTHASSDWQIYSDSGLTTLVWESVDDTTNLESIDVPSGNLSTSTTYYWRVRYTGSTYGDSEWSTATDFTTASSFFDHGPGPGEASLTYDSTTVTGFYGETTTSELTDGSTLCSDIGLSAGTLHNDTEPWLKFFVGASADCNPDGVDKVLYIPKKSYRYDLSWDDIYDAGCVYGVDGPGPYNSANGDTNQYTTVTYAGYDFVVQLMTGSENNPASIAQGNTQCNDDVGNASEWNDLMYRMHNLVPDCASPSTGTSNTDYHGGPQEGDNWASYTDSELNVNTGDGKRTWCQEAGNDTSRRVYRGDHGVATFFTYSSDHTYTDYGFRPCLVLVQP